jgi:hypothetical protein
MFNRKDAIAIEAVALASQAGPENCGLHRFYQDNHRATLGQRFDASTSEPSGGGGVHPSSNPYGPLSAYDEGTEGEGPSSLVPAARHAAADPGLERRHHRWRLAPGGHPPHSNLRRCAWRVAPRAAWRAALQAAWRVVSRAAWRAAARRAASPAENNKEKKMPLNLILCCKHSKSAEFFWAPGLL